MSEAVIIALITAVPATLAAVPGVAMLRRTRTNHGKNIGQHVEEQGQDLKLLLSWAEFHQAADNEVRGALGLEPASYPLTKQVDQAGLDSA